MVDDKITTWINLQRKTWDSDQGLRAELIALESLGGDLIGSWPVDLENLPGVS